MMVQSDRITDILNHELTKMYYAQLQENESERIYCKHNYEHMKETARVAVGLNHDMKLGLSDELLQAAAYLHDIGKARKTEEPHAHVSAELAVPILKLCGFEDKETAVIYRAIWNHSNKQVKSEAQCPIGVPPMEWVLARADSLSRACYECKVWEQCNWDNGRKNKERYQEKEETLR